MAAARRAWVLPVWLVGLFAAGVATGAFATVGLVHHRLRALHTEGPEAINALAAEWLNWELDLDAEQQTAIRSILVETHEQFFRFKSEHNDEIRAIVLPALERIDAQLTSEQKTRWAGMRARIVDHVEATLEPHGRDSEPKGR